MTAKESFQPTDTIVSLLHSRKLNSNPNPDLDKREVGQEGRKCKWTPPKEGSALGGTAEGGDTVLEVIRDGGTAEGGDS